MRFPVDIGEKYALIALNAATDIQDPIDLDSGYSAHPKGSLELPAHFREWLGTLRAGAIERSTLFLLIKAKSERPSALDNENKDLLSQADCLFWGLLACGPLHMEGAGTQVTGANVGDAPYIRQVGEQHHLIRVPGTLPKNVTVAHLRRAKSLAINLQELLATPGMRLMKLAMRTFLLGAVPDYSVSGK